MKTNYKGQFYGSRWIFDHGNGEATATAVPGTAEVMHIHDAVVDEPHRGKGLGAKYHEERLEWFEHDDSITLLTCIVNADNEPQLHILKTHGWERIKKFKGAQGQELYLCCKEVNHG